MHRPFLRQFMLFVAALTAAMAVAAFFITTQVMQSGLEDLFRERLERAESVFAEYTRARHLSRVGEVEGLVTSPRFLAAVETQDPATITREMPTHGLLADAEIAWVRGPRGETLYRSDSLSEDTYRSRFEGLERAAETACVIEEAGSDTWEILQVPLIANNGRALGSLWLGRRIAGAWIGDLQRLTGFEIVLARDGVEFGRSVSGLLGPDVSGAPLLALPAREARRLRLAGEDVVAFRLETEEGVSVVFVGELGPAIAPVMQRMTGWLLGMALLGALVSIAGVWAFMRRRVQPRVAELVGHAERIAAGDLDFRIRSDSADELGKVARALEGMRADLFTNRRELEDAHRAQLEGERMAAIGQMATGIVHDFKNPMSVVQGTAELIRARSGGDEKTLRQCAAILRQVDRMGVLTRDLLEYARGRTDIEVETVRLADWLREIEAGQHDACRREGVRLDLAGPDELVVRVDPDRMRRVVDNVLNNAREVSAEGDTVELRWFQDESNDVVLEVRDHGPGIPADLQDSLFDPFVTAGKKNGSGLGLAISKKIVEAHGARIDVDSAPGDGARFVIRIPEAAGEGTDA